MALGKKIYVVARGKKPGVYTAWAGKGQAQEQVQGQAGAVFKSFASAGPARVWLAGIEGHPPDVMKALKKLPGSNSGSGTGSGHETALKQGKFVVYTDGGCSGNPGPGGYGCVILHGDSREEISGGFRLTTNNRMEILACIASLEAVADRRSDVVLISDSRYVVDAMNKGWAKKWRSRRWMRNDTEPAKNPDLWERLLNLCEDSRVEFRWVKGHAGTEENERCDVLAVVAAAQADLPEDVGYGDGSTLTLF